MEKKNPEEVIRWFYEELEKLTPAGLGSLSLRKSPCTYPGCHLCETGEGHSSYVLYVRRKGKRRAVYVPGELAGEVKRMVESGRKVQELMKEFAIKYTEALRDARKEKGKKEL